MLRARFMPKTRMLRVSGSPPEGALARDDNRQLLGFS
jgi:hypothetical protein